MELTPCRAPMTENGDEPCVEEMAARIDDTAAHLRAEAALHTLGPDRAVIALRAYLRRGAQSIPQPRCFAVAMLARIATADALAALREALRDPPWPDLPPLLAEAEYVVKNDIVDALAARDYAQRSDDVAFGVAARLPAALRAAMRLRLGELAAPIAALLGDDVLASPARDALRAFGAAAIEAVAASVDAALTVAEPSVRTRLAAIRGLRVLAGIDGDNMVVARRALRDEHPLVRAAAALLLVRTGEDGADALVRGAVGADSALADACRAALASPSRAAKRAAAAALARGVEPDLYGNPRRLGVDARRWLARFISACDECSR